MRTVSRKRKGYEDVVRGLRADGNKLRAIAEGLGIPLSMVYRILKGAPEIKK